MLLILFFQIVILKFLKIFCLVLWFKKKIFFLFAHSKVIKMFFIFSSLEANCFTFYI